jgi:uncharacterized protein
LEFLRYSKQSDTIDRTFKDNNLFQEESDLVSHSFFKYLYLLSRSSNGYVMEQLFSPLIICTSSLHEELKELAMHCISQELKYHYGGFIRNQKALLQKEKKQVKLILYQARIIASSVFVAQNKAIEANLVTANNATNIFDKDKLAELIEIKKNGEKDNFPDQKLFEYWTWEIEKKLPLINKSFEESNLPHFDALKVNMMAKDLINRNFELKNNL